MNTGSFNFAFLPRTPKQFNKKSTNIPNIPNIPKKTIQTIPEPIPQKIFDPNKYFYICSFGGSGSTILFNYLSCFGNVEHIHDRYPPDELSYVGTKNTTDNIYNEWFNKIKIPPVEIKNFKVIYIYRNPIDVIFSRFIGPNKPHLKNVMCENENITLEDVVVQKKDLYKLDEFYENYTVKQNKNYPIYCIKYEQFFNNIELFNKTLGIPNIKKLYPQKYERKKKKYYLKQLNIIYRPLISKMQKMPFIKII